MFRTLIATAAVALVARAPGLAASDPPVVASVKAAAASPEGPCPPDGNGALAPETPVPPPATAPSPVRLRGQKVSVHQLQRSEAGVSWSLGPKVTLELDYERSALAPMMPHDHDDGFLTRFKIGF